MREFKFRYARPQPNSWTQLITGEIPSRPPEVDYVEFRVFHWDYYKARDVANRHFDEWKKVYLGNQT